MRLTIELPLPPVEASPNHQPDSLAGRRIKRKRIAEWQMDCYRAILAAKADRFTRFPVTIHLDFYCGPSAWGRGDGQYRPRDEGNARAAFKHAQDMLVRAGVLPDDAARYVRDGETRLHRARRAHKGLSRLLVTLEEPEE